MQKDTENVNPLERNVNVLLPQEQIEAEVDNRLKRLSRTVKLHGFRPGKVPLKVVAQQYGTQVRQEVLSDALRKGFTEAVESQKLRVAGYPRFEAKEGTEGAGLEFVATFEVYPEIKVGDVSGETVERPACEVAESDVDKTIEVLRKQRVRFQQADKAAAEGDNVSIDYRGLLDGEEFEGGKAENYSFVIGQGRLLKAFEDNVVGLKTGESKSFELTFPEDYHGKDLAGKTVTFEITVRQVREPILPELDAEFAKSLGVADGDVAKMRQEVKGNLEREVKGRIQARIKEQVMQALLNVTKVDLPKSLVELEIDRLMRQAREDMTARGMQAKDIPLPADMFEENAKRRVSLGLLLAELVKEQGLEAKPEEVRSLVEEFAQSYENPDQVVNWYYQNPERLREVEALALENNVVAWVLDKAKVQDKTVSFDDLMGNA